MNCCRREANPCHNVNPFLSLSSGSRAQRYTPRIYAEWIDQQGAKTGLQAIARSHGRLLRNSVVFVESDLLGCS
jgi:hypothetical protein